MTVAVIIQARMRSTRLPGKVMLSLPGGTVLSHVASRAAQAKNVDIVAIATSILPDDDIIAEEGHRLGFPVYRGSEIDVLSRYAMANRVINADTVVRITSDCPLIDTDVIDAMLNRFTSSQGTFDYMSNCIQRTFPRGLDVEIMTASALAIADAEASAPHEREHVTPFIYLRPERFRIGSFQQSRNLSHLRWTLDTTEDWAMISEVYRLLNAQGLPINTKNVLRLLETRPDLAALNADVEQKTFCA
jgi:spore coat polysaccharide biosynthesis protein SpsF